MKDRFNLYPPDGPPIVTEADSAAGALRAYARTWGEGPYRIVESSDERADGVNPESGEHITAVRASTEGV